jgi:nucleoid DNA-binding protein
MATLKEAADNGDSVRLPGIGTFKRNEIDAHEATNPGTGEKVNVPKRSNYKLNSPTQDVE